MERNELRRNQGFTIIELVVVIVIIGILAATALPRFVNLTDDAHTANVQAIGSSLRSGITMAHASWIAKGATTSTNNVTVEGGGVIGLTDLGWPQNDNAGGGDGTPTSSECLEIFQELLNPAPPAATGTTSDWRAQAANTTACRYTYNAAPGRQIDYDVADGSVTITVP